MPIASCSIFVASLFRGSPLPRPALSMASTSATKKSTSELNKSPTNWFASPKRFAVRFFRSSVAAQKYLLAQQDRTGDKEICFQESPRESPRRSPERDTMIEPRSEEHTSELQSQSNLVCRLLLEKKKSKLHRLLTA